MTNMNGYYKPFSTVVVHELSEKTVEEFVHIHCRENMQEPPLYCDGYLLFPFSFPPSELLAHKQLDLNEIHFQEVSYAKCGGFMKTLKRDDLHFETPVVNMDCDNVMQTIVKLIKSGGKMV